MKWAHENKYEWLWILDDDTMANENALEEFIGKYDTFPSEKKPVVLASKVLWTDGTPHPMNFSVIRNGEYEQSLFAAEYGTINIRSSSFVSFMVNSTMIDKYGLPIKEYFIWNDDAEYSARVLKMNLVCCARRVSLYTKRNLNIPQWNLPETGITLKLEINYGCCERILLKEKKNKNLSVLFNKYR